MGVVPKPGPGGGGYPSQVQVGGTPTGVPHLGFPRQTWYPTWGTPPGQTWPGGAPTGGGGVPHQVVLDTPRSVCLLRSCRRTFLFLFLFLNWNRVRNTQIHEKEKRLFTHGSVRYIFAWLRICKVNR